jgi:hypothetical protein
MKSVYKNKYTACLLAIILLNAACNKNNDNGGEQLPDEEYLPGTYSPGILQGTAVQKSIGAAGGVLTSADGKISLTIPAGALTTEVNLSVQSITNTLPLSAGPAFRLLPAATTFSKPLTVEYTYDSASFEGSDEEALDLAYQDSDGTWKALNNTVQDKAQHKLRVQHTRLRDMGLVRYYVLRPQKATLVPSEVTTLDVSKVSVPNDNAAGDETPLGEVVTVQRADAFGEWKLTGNGNMDAAQASKALYTAPATVPANFYARVSTVLKGTTRPRRKAGRNTNLQHKLHIVINDFMTGVYDGDPFECVLVNLIIGGGKTTIQGVTATGESVALFLQGATIGAYPYGDPASKGTANIGTTFGNKDYQAWYVLCGPPQTLHYSAGEALVKSFGLSAGSDVAGEFGATIYDMEGCTVKEKYITVEFRVRRTY